MTQRNEKYFRDLQKNIDDTDELLSTLRTHLTSSTNPVEQRRIKEQIETAESNRNFYQSQFDKHITGSAGITASVQQPQQLNESQPTQSWGVRTKVFISYAHEDKDWLDRLQVNLKPLERSGVVERWDDSRIKPGMRWRDEIRKALATTKVAVLLVSADFLASDFIDNKELPSLLEASANEGAVILPVILRPCRFRESILSEFQSFNPSSKPFSSLSKPKQEEQLVELTRVIEEALKR